MTSWREQRRERIIAEQDWKLTGYMKVADSLYRERLELGQTIAEKDEEIAALISRTARLESIIKRHEQKARERVAEIAALKKEAN
jgi:predicted RNase H-like nuclease (RuvC/YqgF family)